MINHLHFKTLREGGAGDENRTHVSSLGSSCSTIELHPRAELCERCPAADSISLARLFSPASLSWAGVGVNHSSICLREIVITFAPGIVVTNLTQGLELQAERRILPACDPFRLPHRVPFPFPFSSVLRSTTDHALHLHPRADPSPHFCRSC